jgi:drug/metabolite transporter (DMT)-like permease
MFIEDDLLPIAAALFSPLVMATGFVLWDANYTGTPFVLNNVKCSAAMVIYILMIGILEHNHLLRGVDMNTAMVLFLSAMLGIVVGDTAWLHAMTILGSKTVILIDALKPFLATIFGVILFKEPVSVLLIIGIMITMVGVLIVALDGANGKKTKPKDKKTAQTQQQQQQQQTPGILSLDTVELEVLEQWHVSAGDTTVHRAVTDTTEIYDDEDTDDTTPGSLQVPEEPTADTDTAVDIEMVTMDLKKQQLTPDGELSEVLQSDEDVTHLPWTRRLLGLFTGVINVIFDVYGSVLIKDTAEDMAPWTIAGMRFGFASIVLGSMFFGLRISRHVCLQATGKQSGTKQQSQQTWQYKDSHLPNLSTKSWQLVLLGVFFATFLNPIMTSYAVFHLPLAVFMTLISMTPVWALPLAYLFKGEKITNRAVIGSVLAVAGIVPLLLHTLAVQQALQVGDTTGKTDDDWDSSLPPPPPFGGGGGGGGGLPPPP